MTCNIHRIILRVFSSIVHLLDQARYGEVVLHSTPSMAMSSIAMSPLTPWPLVACSMIFQLLFCGGMLTLASCHKLPRLPASKSNDIALKQIDRHHDNKCNLYSTGNLYFIVATL